MTSKIDFERAGTLMDVVQKVASVSPSYMAISGAAMRELKEMNDTALEEQKELAAQRLKEENEAAARLNEQNRIAAEKQAKIDQEVANRTQASRGQPLTVMPGEPVPAAVRREAGETEPNDDPAPHEVQGELEPIDTTPVVRRV